MAQAGDILRRQRGRKARLAEFEAKLLRLAGPADGAGLAWFKPLVEQVRDAAAPVVRAGSCPAARP